MNIIKVAIQICEGVGTFSSITIRGFVCADKHQPGIDTPLLSYDGFLMAARFDPPTMGS